MNSKQDVESTISNTKKLIVHIATDEKFINSAYWQFNNLNGVENVFYILVKDVNEKLKYVLMHDDMTLVEASTTNLKKLAKNITDCDLVCFHSLNVASSIVMNYLPLIQKTMWIFFGYEIYNNSVFFNKKEILGLETYEQYLLALKSKSLKSRIKDILRTPYYWLIKKSLLPSREFDKSIKKVDYLGVLYKEDFELVKQKIATNIKHFKFTLNV